MKITSQGRKRAASDDFARILDLMMVIGPSGQEAEVLAGVRRFVAVSICSRDRARNFPDSEVKTFVASNVQYLDNIITAALRRAYEAKLRGRKNPPSWNERITEQNDFLDRLEQQGLSIHLAAAPAKIATDTELQRAVSEPSKVGIANPAVSWTSPQITSGVHEINSQEI